MTERQLNCAVVIPAYNAERYVSKTVHSVLASSEVNVEVVIVNDGSTDTTGVIADDLACRFSNVRCLHQPNGGVSAARNVGLGAVSAEAVCFLDADDQLEPNGLTLLREALSTDLSLAAAFGQVRYIDANAESLPRNSKLLSSRKKLKGIMSENFTDTPGAVLFRTNCVRNVNGFNPMLKHGEDWELYVRVAELGDFLGVASEVVAYRLHEASVMHGGNLDFKPALNAVFRQHDWKGRLSVAELQQAEIRKRIRLARLTAIKSRGVKPQILNVARMMQLVVASGFDSDVVNVALHGTASAAKRLG